MRMEYPFGYENFFSLIPSREEDRSVSCVGKCRDRAHLAHGQVFTSGKTCVTVFVTSEIALRTFG